MCILVIFFFFNDTATTEIYTLSLHDALPIYETFVAQSCLYEASDVIVAQSDGDGVHLKGEVGGGCGLLLRVGLAGFGESFLLGTGEVNTCGGRSVKLNYALLEINHFAYGQHDEVLLGLLDVLD